MITHYILDDNGTPVPEPDDIRYADWRLRNEHRRRVARTEIGDTLVSTVFLTTSTLGPPEWETMVFGGPLDHESDSYSSFAHALVGHERMVERVNAAVVRLC